MYNPHNLNFKSYLKVRADKKKTQNVYVGERTSLARFSKSKVWLYLDKLYKRVVT
jgi:hypothetical protein